MTRSIPNREDKILIRAMNASLAVGIFLLAIKLWAAARTGSSAIYSDAAESVVHLLAVIFASYSLRIAAKPADETHHYGHDKAEYLSAGFEGAMISAAACLILYEGFRSWWVGPHIEDLKLGIYLTITSTAINTVLAISLIVIGRRQRSILLEANGQHILTDVKTSVGVLLGLQLVLWTGNTFWDPLSAILVALNILWTGGKLVQRSMNGLMDASDPVVEKKVREILEKECAARGLQFHQLRYRNTGRTHWVEVHLVFPDGTSIESAHTWATEIESTLNAHLESAARIISHLEPRSEGDRSQTWEE
ncbi:MAG: cation diffusion facilitator family transporter [Verrucomicrobiales bacterium]